MIVKAWFVWVLMSSGQEGTIPQRFDTLEQCLAFESTITKDVEESKCFFGTVKPTR